MEEVILARQMAESAHERAGSIYDGGPYSAHLQAVAQILSDYGYTDKQSQVCAWLHDAVEDTDLTLEDIRKAGFGESIVRIVGAVTTPRSLGNRAARLERLILQLQAVPEALPLKLADRIANTRHSKEHSPEMFRMYRREYHRFRTALRTLECPEQRTGRLVGMWDELDYLKYW